MSSTGRGSVRKDKQRNTWLYVLDVPGVDGARRQERRRGFPTRKAATDALDARRREVFDGLVPPPDRTSVRAFATSWVAALPAEGIAPATVKHYKEAVARLLPNIGDVRLQQLTSADLDAAYAALLDAGLSNRTVRASHVAARKMLKEALRLERVGRNVADKARPPAAKSTKPKVFPTWTVDELGAFLDAVSDHDLAPAWQLAAWTGLRLGELVALRWQDVDLSAGTVTVCRSIGKGLDGWHEKLPKSDDSLRVVELDPALVAVLRAHKRQQHEHRLAIGPAWNGDEFVFCGPMGDGLTPNYVSKAWSDLVRRIAPKLGLQVIRLHDLRHSHATQLLAAGVRPDVVTKRLGHASVAFTLDRYVHQSPGDQRSAIARIRSSALPR